MLTCMLDMVHNRLRRATIVDPISTAMRKPVPSTIRRQVPGTLEYGVTHPSAA